MDSNIADSSTTSIYDEFFTTYIIPPFHNKVSMVVIMADLGSRLEEGDLSDIAKLKERLKELKKTVDMLAKKMCHGDLLPHNFVLDHLTDMLHIIDLDEGGIDDVPRREWSENCNDVIDEDKWFLPLRYPVREIGNYTQKCSFGSYYGFS